MQRRAIIATAIVIISILLSMYIPQPKPVSISKMLPPNSQSYIVNKLAGKKIGGATLIVVTKKPYYELGPTFAKLINDTLKKQYHTYSKMDYFTLKKYITKKLNITAVEFIKKNYKYIMYLKDLVEQLDGIGIYMYDTMNNVWNIYMKVKNVPRLYERYFELWNRVKLKVNTLENELYKIEESLSVELSYYIFKTSKLLNKVLSIVLAFNDTRTYYVESYKTLMRLLNEYCAYKNMTIRKMAEIMSVGSGYEGLIRRLMAQALISTWVTWQGTLCNNGKVSHDFVTAVLAYFVSLAPQSLSEYASFYNLTRSQMKNVVLLATTLSPNATSKEVKDALLESIRLVLGLNIHDADLALKALKGDKKAFALLLVDLMKVNNACFRNAIIESVIQDKPVVLTSIVCEKREIGSVLRKARLPHDKNLMISIIAMRGMDNHLVRYEAFYSTVKSLTALGLPLNVSLALVDGKISPQTAIKYYLKSNDILYPNCVLEALNATRLVEAQKRAIMCVYKKLASTMIAYGFSKSAVDTMIYNLIVLGPGLTKNQVNEVVYRTLMAEINSLRDPRLELLNTILNINDFIRKIVWSESLDQALMKVQKDILLAADKFMKKYVAVKLLVGKDGRHIIFALAKDVGFPPRLNVKSYFVSPKWISEEIRQNTLHDINFVNKVGAILVFLALLISVKSFRLSLIPVVIIYIVLQYYKALVVGLESIGIKETSIDMVIATATILGMGIDYSLFTAARYKRGNFLWALRPVLVAASLASMGFLVFGLVSAVFLPGLRTLGLFVPLAILFTAIVGPSITALFKEVLGIREEQKIRKVPPLTVISSEMPKTVLLLAFIVVVASLYLLLTKPPGYDLYLFLPKNSESVRALEVLQRYSSPGLVGPTIIALKINTNNMALVAREVEALARYFLETGYFNYAFTYTRPLGKYVTTDPRVLDLIGGKLYVKNGWLFLYLLPSKAPDSSTMVSYVKVMRKFLENWIKGKPFSEALVGGESAVNYDISNAVNKITLNYVIPIMTIITVVIFVFLFRRFEMVVPATITSLVSMIATLGLSIFIISNILKITTLWIVVPLTITVVLSVGSDYSVFYFFGLKASIEECKILEEGECAHKMNALYYNAAKMFSLILGFATTFAVAYFSLLISNIWALRELGISLGIAPLMLVVALFTLVPAILALIWRQ